MGVCGVFFFVFFWGGGSNRFCVVACCVAVSLLNLRFLFGGDPSGCRVRLYLRGERAGHRHVYCTVGLWPEGHGEFVLFCPFRPCI